MKKTFAITLLAVATLSGICGCNKKSPSQQVKSNGLPRATAASVADSVSNSAVAVVDIDTLAARCAFCIQGQSKLEAKQASYRTQLESKARKLQTDMVAFQNKVQNGGFTSQQQAEAAQKQLQKQQQAVQSFQSKVESEMATATQNYQNELRRKLADFLKMYNADGRYKVIISKSGDNVLYTDPSVDITSDVIQGLNQIEKKQK